MKSTNNLVKAGVIAGSLLYGFNLIAKKLRTIDFNDKVVLITGGARGLGLVMARQLAKEGAKIAICSRDEQQLEYAKLDLLKGGAKDVLAITCDIKDKAQVEKMIGEVENHFTHIDILINNAGIITVGAFSDLTDEDFKEAMDTSFWGALYTTKAVVNGMRERKEGRIVNISSVGGKIAVPHMTSYSAAKFAMAGLSEGLRSELRKDNIFVTSVFPGLMRTGSHINAEFKGKTEEEYKWFSESDLNPLISESVESAAAQIINAIRVGDAELSFPYNTMIASKLNAVFPNLSADFMTLFDALLPKAGGKEKLKGFETEVPLTPKVLDQIGYSAAAKNNEL